MKKFSKITKSILITTLLAMAACLNGESKVEGQQSATPSFPESASRQDTGGMTAVLPAASPMSTPMQEDAEEPAPMVEPIMPEPQKFSEWMQRGRTRFESQDLEGAASDYRAAVEERPGAQRAQIQLARTLLSMGNSGEARVHAELALEIDGSSSFAWNTMGRVELAKRENEAAIASFERATEEDADNSYAWNNLGFVLIEEGLYEEAVDALEEATTGGTPKSYMWNNLGMAYEHQDQIEFARAAYRQAGNAGSAKALANFQRLEGVDSLLASGDEAEPIAPEALSEALELPGAETPVDVVDLEVPTEANEPVEVAEVLEP
ncbi:MAG: tetratricopeptide repeat protein [Myxococcales bacterium]|nr:tetratricopeptide repeat protein [Myxococcales bacterium]